MTFSYSSHYNCTYSLYLNGVYSTEEGKDQESIQSSTTPDPEHHMVK